MKANAVKKHTKSYRIGGGIARCIRVKPIHTKFYPAAVAFCKILLFYYSSESKKTKALNLLKRFFRADKPTILEKLPNQGNLFRVGVFISNIARTRG